MSHFTDDRLWELLPAIHRIRDAASGELRALIEVLAAQARVLEGDIDQLYDDLFIETCDEWVVPYIGDLLGVTNLHGFATKAAFSQRARVANTITYRRRKGTAPMLEQLAFDTTGWRCRVVEFFLRLDTTQHINHVRAEHVRTLDLRRTATLELIGGAFDPAAYTVDVRPVAEGAPRPNIPNVGLYLWRLAAYPISRSEARPHVAPADGRYTFDPLGLDVSLFNWPRTETEITQLAREVNVPARLRRRALYDELEARRQTMAENSVLDQKRAITYAWFDDREHAEHPPVLQVFVDEEYAGIGPEGKFTAIPAEEIMICNLSAWDAPGWTPPPATKTYSVREQVGATVPVSLPIRAFVDPELGRLAFPAGASPSVVHVSHASAFAGDVGAGSYPRIEDSGDASLALSGWVAAVGRAATLAALDPPATGVITFTSLIDAVVAWNAQVVHATGYIVLLDNSAVAGDLSGSGRIEVGEGRRLTVVAADWPGIGSGLTVERDGRRALLRGVVDVIGTAPAGSSNPGQVCFDGVLSERRIRVLAGHLGALEFDHSTLVEGVTVETTGGTNPALAIALRRTITGPILASHAIQSVATEDSIVHGRSLLESASDHGVSLAGDALGTMVGPAVSLLRTTVFGRVLAQTLEASETIFVAPVVAERLQEGCVRFSFVPVGRDGQVSRTPRRYRCQPDLAVDARAAALGLERAALPAAEVARVIAAILPQFTSTRFGDPAFAQLATACPNEIRTGAEDGSEMGVFSFLKNPQREANLRASLDEYLRLGLEAGLVFVT